MKEIIERFIRTGKTTAEIQSEIIEFPDDITTEYLEKLGFEEIDAIKLKWKLRQNDRIREAEIKAAIEGVISINPSDVLPQLEYAALRIDQKISDALLMNDVRNHVLQYYRYIETIFSEMTDVFDDIAGEVKLSSQKLEKSGLSQEDVIYNLTEWIHNKAFAGDTKGKMACRIVVCFFIQNCEVFYKNEISK